MVVKCSPIVFLSYRKVKGDNRNPLKIKNDD